MSATELTRAIGRSGQTSGMSLASEGSRWPLTAAAAAGAAGAGAAFDDDAEGDAPGWNACSSAVASRRVTSLRSLYSRARAARACRMAY